MREFGIVLLLIVLVALSIALFIGGVYVVQLNINDMITHGVNFWNTFWIMLVALVLFGGTSKAAS